MRFTPYDAEHPFEGLSIAPTELQAFLERVPFVVGDRRREAKRIALPTALPVAIPPLMSTQQGFGALLNELGRDTREIAERIVTTSPDVTVSTNLGGWVNRRGLFAREALADIFKSERIPSTFNWDFSPRGQHIELGIAEMNLFILLSALRCEHPSCGLVGLAAVAGNAREVPWHRVATATGSKNAPMEAIKASLNCRPLLFVG